MKKSITLAVCLALIVSLLCPIYAAADALRDRNGFDPQTNVTCEVGNIRYQIPSYYIDAGLSDDKKVHIFGIQQADNQTVCMLLLFTETFEVTQQQFESDKYDDCQIIINKLVKDCLFKKIDVEDPNIAILRGISESDANKRIHAAAIYTGKGFVVSALIEDLSNSDGYSYYEDFERIIRSAAAVEAAPSQSSSAPAGVTPSVKAMLDSYEEFFDEYAQFMDDYKKNPSDFSLLMKYTTMLAKYAEIMQKLSDMQSDSSMTAADAAYVLQVYSRILQKLSGTLSGF